MKSVIDFLLLNGFEKRLENVYFNDECEIIWTDEDYTIRFNGGEMYSDNLNIYWLIGVLTYNNLMEKNYNQL